MPKKETRKTSDGRYVLRDHEYERSDKKGYQYKVRDPKTQRFVSVSATTLKELREKEDVLMRDLLDGISSVKGKDTVDAYYEIWSQNKRIKKNVLANYKYMYQRFIRPALGSRRLKDLKYTTIQSFYLDLVDTEKVAVNTLEVINNILHQILEQAVRDDVIRRNVSDGVVAEIKKRYPQPKKREALTMDEQNRFIEMLQRDDRRAWMPVFMSALRTGLRVGELTGLTWDDIDFDSRTLHVRRTLVYYAEDGKCWFAINDTKTATSFRDIPLTDEVIEYLRIQQAEGTKCKMTVDGVTGFVFCNRFGEVQHQGTLNKALKRIIRDANMEEDAVALPPFSCHHLRHTFCTNMIKAGVELTAVSALMGHKSIETTADIYNTVLRESKELAVNQVAEYLQSENTGTPVITKV